LDGSLPTIQSNAYDGAIVISDNTTLNVLSIEGERTSNLLKVEFKKAKLTPSIQLDQAINGLSYVYYEGKWERMPEFSTLKAIKSGRIDAIDLSMVEEDKDYFGVVYKGYILIPEDDVHTFYSSSDDGSFIIIDDIRVVENDGIHGVVEKIGQIGLQAGYHKFEVQFFDNWYDHVLRVEIESKNLPRQQIPSSMLFYLNKN